MITIEYLRSFRVGEFAIFDFVVSFIGIFLLSPLLSKLARFFRLNIPLKSWMFFTIPFSVLAHILVGNITPLTEAFIRLDGGIFVKVFVVTLFVLGARSVSTRKK
ncbi:MAG: hypothetical protein GW762_04960 [Candidatus Pacebacteria bacterium]|nr:hypothetical protein [Candidatus Paceibacterota bacterium]PIR63962.1 MAG: hypothetical protein COU64_01785 [Candidatus Pacebacteria bacterium CG10_big_fil_rev_8_21_14_0_10_40_26]PIZ78661.1 MAG: hypothetical protein COY01_03450 [Candidatus Pacebacteria bacterium CG_4_10_14_0_2_um_filter_40_20]PJA68487.1 MAG: hypothetical protein CO156_05865 [Candidatus Pacebacteria bacterium CG_4_9_14_3_um_filter_40_12]PJC41884.1 MAG: hypothetical protein CO041_04150 [Candidatus Pacebacteria bacterium CG_4_9_